VRGTTKIRVEEGGGAAGLYGVESQASGAVAVLIHWRWEPVPAPQLEPHIISRADRRAAGERQLPPTPLLRPTLRAHSASLDSPLRHRSSPGERN